MISSHHARMKFGSLMPCPSERWLDGERGTLYFEVRTVYRWIMVQTCGALPFAFSRDRARVRVRRRGGFRHRAGAVSQGGALIRVISARDMHCKERAIYERAEKET